MVRNIIFDLGNVLLTFKPAEYLTGKGIPAGQRETILKDVFGSIEWRMIDDGSLGVPEATELIASKTTLKREEIERIFENRTEMLLPIDSNIKLLPELKKEGFRLFYLSNFPLDIFDEVKETSGFFHFFDGGLISAIAGCSKPDPEIYRKLLDLYDLDPAVSLFIDDLNTNVNTALLFGMKGVCTAGAENIGPLVRSCLS